LRIIGVDFTSAPKRDKPIVVADCEANDRQLKLRGFLEFSDWPAYDLWLGEDAEWIGGFDFPFGLPRRFVEAQGWAGDWSEMVRDCVQGGKERFAETAMRAFVGARTPEDKHRKTDFAARSHSPLKTRTNPPVGLMFYEGASRLVANRIRVPVMNDTSSKKIALEAYPGLLISQLGERYYKNDKAHTLEANTEARRRIIERLKGSPDGVLSCSLSVRDPSALERLRHGSGDWLDAVLCAMQAHWGWRRRRTNFGLPHGLDAVEGWIVGARTADLRSI
jgi:uncharacterized protein DUF429